MNKFYGVYYLMRYLFSAIHRNRRPVIQAVIIMKLICFLTFALSWGAWANTMAQKVTLHTQSASFKSVIQQIQRQSGYSFIIKEEFFKQAKPVSLVAEDKEVLDLLPQLFRGQPFDYAVQGNIVSAITRSKKGNPATAVDEAQQQQPLRGRIINEKGEPLVGASVYVLDDQGKRTLVQTKTGEDGVFELGQDAMGRKIEVVYLGYTAQKILVSSDMGTIALKPFSAEVDEVEVMVNTGYQQLPKERATGSFAFVSKDQINEQINFNIMDRLPAVASGLVVDRNAKSAKDQFLVRGMSTIQGETQPLIVLDNFPFEGDLRSINPDDIQNITILRDAAAASIWGARAGNGVIVITTKKGTADQKLKIDLNLLTTVQQKLDLFSLDRVSSSDMIDVETMLFDKGYHDGSINSTQHPVLSPIVELLIRKKASQDQYEITEIDEEISRLRNVDVRNDFERYLYQIGLQQQSTIGLSQGTDRLIWNASIGNGLQIDNLDSRVRRDNVLMNAKLLLSKSLTFEGGMNISFQNVRSGRPGYGNIIAGSGLFPYAELADADGNALPLLKDWRGMYLEQQAERGLLDWQYYPLEDYKHSVQKQQTQNTILSTALTYKLPKWFGLSLRYQYQAESGRMESLSDIDSYEARNMINSYAVLNTATGKADFKVPKGGIFDQSNSMLRSHNVRGQLDFNWEEDLHKVYALMGSELRNVSSLGNDNRLYGYNEDNLSYAQFDLTVPYVHYVTGAKNYVMNGLSISQKKNRFISTFLNASYLFDEKYTATFSARRDASNLFGLNVKDKWNPFWSAGLGWTISNEKFWNPNVVSYLKLRTTYGKGGNLNPAKVALTTIKYAGPNPFTQTPYAWFDNYANPELKWESVSTVNIGLDFAMKNKRISGTLEGYLKKGSDLYGITPVDYTTGIGAFVVKNVAAMQGKGLDLNLNSVNTTGPLRWNTDLNLSFNSDKITKYHMESRAATQFIRSTNPISGKEAAPVYSMYSYKWMGLDPTDGAALGLLDGQPSREYRKFTGSNATVDDLVFHGSILPKIFGSIGNTIAWSDWVLTMRWTFKFDYYFRRETIRYSSLFSAWNGHGDFNDRWRQSGDEKKTDIPAMAYPVLSGAENFYPYAEPFVERGDHVRFEYLNLAYRIKGTAKNWFKDVLLSLNVNNLGLIYRKNKAGIDPDFSTSSNTGFSPSKIYSFNIKCTL